MVAALADELPSNAAFASSFGDQLYAVPIRTLWE